MDGLPNKEGRVMTAIVTGGGSGIGRAAAMALSGAGFRVGLIGRRAERLMAAADEISAGGGESWWAPLDVRDERAVRAFVQAAVDNFGKIDLLVNCAGVFRLTPMDSLTLDEWDETIGVNLRAAFICAQAVWPHIAGGQIINISSVAGLRPFAGCAAYSASKYGLRGLTEVLALEGRPRGIRVHVVCPGNTNTPLWSDQAPAEVQARMMDPADVAEVVRWLALSPPDVTFDRIAINPLSDPWR